MIIFNADFFEILGVRSGIPYELSCRNEIPDRDVLFRCSCRDDSFAPK